MKTLISSHSVLYLVLLIGSITFFVPGIASSAEPSTDVVKATSPKKNQKSYKFTGGLSVAASTDRNAGIAPIADSAQGDLATDDDEDGDGDESFAAPDAFEDMDLDDQDAVDQLDETIDQDGDGDFLTKMAPVTMKKATSTVTELTIRVNSKATMMGMAFPTQPKSLSMKTAAEFPMPPPTMPMVMASQTPLKSSATMMAMGSSMRSI